MASAICTRDSFSSISSDWETCVEFIKIEHGVCLKRKRKGCSMVEHSKHLRFKGKASRCHLQACKKQPSLALYGLQLRKLPSRRCQDQRSDESAEELMRTARIICNEGRDTQFGDFPRSGCDLCRTAVHIDFGYCGMVIVRLACILSSLVPVCVFRPLPPFTPCGLAWAHVAHVRACMPACQHDVPPSSPFHAVGFLSSLLWLPALSSTSGPSGAPPLKAHIHSTPQGPPQLSLASDQAAGSPCSAASPCA